MLLPRQKPLPTKTRQHREDTTMNADNRRLQEIQQLKKGYKKLRDKSLKITEILDYTEKIKKLTQEETEILKRSDAL